MILIAIAATALHPHQQALNDCMARNALELGGKNTLDVQSVIRAAEARCGGEWDHAERVWRGNRLVDRLNGNPANDGGERADRDAAFLAAFEAVAAARK